MWRDWINDGNWRVPLILAFPVMVAFHIVPYELYFPNRLDWGADIGLVLYMALAGGGVYAVMLAKYLLLARFRPGWVSFYVLASFYLGVIVLLNDVLAPLQLDILTGGKTRSPEPLSYSILELSVAAVALAVFLCFDKRKLHQHAATLSIVLAAGVAVYAALIAYTEFTDFAASPQAQMTAPGQKLPANNGLPNVYHIVLDSMQTDAFVNYIELNDKRGELRGFDLYRNNTANYPFTRTSTPSYLTGTLHENRNFTDWHSYREPSIYQVAKNAGYRTHMFARKFLNNRYIDVFVTNDEVLKKSARIAHPNLTEFVYLWLARLMPNFLTNESLKVGRRAGDLVSFYVNQGDRVIPKTRAEGYMPFTSVLVFDQAIATEETRAQNGQYVYIHPIIPHEPYVLDGACLYRLPRKSRWKSRKEEGIPANTGMLYFEQVSCGARKLFAFLETLKALGRYDGALIVVHGDHGHGYEGEIVRDGDRVRGTFDKVNGGESFRKQFHPMHLQQVLARTMALLMIKAPGSTDEFAVLEDQTQLIDIYPTIVGLLALEADVERVDGANIYGPTGIDRNRKVRFFYHKPNRSEDTPIEKFFVEIDEATGRRTLVSAGLSEER